MAIEKRKQTRPAGDQDLAGQRDVEDVNIRDGGVGFSGSGFASTGRVGGLRNTADGAHSRRDGDPSMEGSNIIDTNLSATGINPDAQGEE